MPVINRIPVGGEPVAAITEPCIPLCEYEPVCDAVLPRTQVEGPDFPVFDIHTHFGRLCLGEHYEAVYDTAEMVDRMKQHGVVKCVNLDAEYGPYYERMMRKLAGYEEFIIQFGTVDMARFEEPGFEKLVYDTLTELKARGVKGVKLWKDLGLGFKDKKGTYLSIDDERIACVWQAAAELGLPILIHIADPPSFFKPIDRFNERYEELYAHPEWAFTKPGMPSWTELLDMFERVVAQNPKTTFIGAHLVCSEDLGRVGRWLRQYPNLHLDMADRINEVGRAPYTARKFFTEFQDRICFGSDVFWPNTSLYNYYYRFFQTFDEYIEYNDLTASKGRWRICGIGLDREVLQKLYSKNACRLLGVEL